MGIGGALGGDLSGGIADGLITVLPDGAGELVGPVNVMAEVDHGGELTCGGDALRGVRLFEGRPSRRALLRGEQSFQPIPIRSTHGLGIGGNLVSEDGQQVASLEAIERNVDASPGD